MDLWLKVSLVIATSFVCRGKEDTVDQSSTSETGPEGGTVTLGCSYDTAATNAYLFWYKQKPNDHPQYMLRRYTLGDGNLLNSSSPQKSCSATEIVDLRLWNTFLFVLCYFECRAEDSVDQLAGFLTASEGDSVTLPCTYTSSSTGLLYLFWYQQKPNGFPAYMLTRFSEMGDNDEGFKKRFEANLTSNSVPLTIQNLQVSDSAVYYCALRPTVADADLRLIQKHQLAMKTHDQPSPPIGGGAQQTDGIMVRSDEM
ncbi:uncharacterized protein LOC125306295 [Alosa alosa]|uniref:uncharacterized protein LOC125306295 n=1 Tax=Alosa alosa TaxID=278164 RepID=UPI00201545E1|nr:uncharacterized protein LOC125306295 [Alosa alosa]